VQKRCRTRSRRALVSDQIHQLANDLLRLQLVSDEAEALASDKAQSCCQRPPAGAGE
jgi:hypothetical protein